ncbi:unnamed protein product, partial [marine sediment metagenome]
GYIFAIPAAMPGIPSLLSILYSKDVFSTFQAKIYRGRGIFSYPTDAK